MATERGILRPLMYQAIKSGASFNSFYRSSQSHDIHMRRSDMLSDWQSVKQEVYAETTSRGLGMGDIPEATEVSNVKFTKPGFFYYRVRVDYMSELTGQFEEQYITAVFDTPATVRDILADVSRKWEAGEYEGLEAVRAFEFVSALHAPIP